MSDPNKKSLRSFQCRDALWDTFGLLSADLECSVDYLINEAMKQYARQRGARSILPDPPRVDTPIPGPAAAAGAAPSAPLALAPPAAQAASGLPPLRLPPPLPWGAQGPGPLGPPRTGRPPPYQHASTPGLHAVPPAYPIAAQPAPGAGRGAVPPPIPAGAPPLAAIYGGARYAVDKDRFVIGRGKQAVDLTIKDPNISRQHALIELQGGQYFLVDMGSTNGLECNGERVVRRAISEGDVVRICDHEVRFTFRRG